MTELFASACVIAGAIVVGCCWAIYNIAFNAGVRAGRNYEQVMRERYEAGRLDASLPSRCFRKAEPVTETETESK